VLDRWKPDEQALIDTTIQEAIQCTQLWLAQGLDVAMNTFNARLVTTTTTEPKAKEPQRGHV